MFQPIKRPIDLQKVKLSYCHLDPQNALASFLWEDAYNTNTKPTIAEPKQRATKWPWLIRIRYRLHDERGEFEGRRIADTTNIGGESTKPERGEWFEVIFPVNRQP